MTKTIHRIRLPEVNSGTFSRKVSKFFIDRNGVLRSFAKKQPSLHIRWQSDAITGKLIAHWESCGEPGSHSHLFPHDPPFHYAQNGQ